FYAYQTLAQKFGTITGKSRDVPLFVHELNVLISGGSTLNRAWQTVPAPGQSSFAAICSAMFSMPRKYASIRDGS
ncbi:MAG: hypothetical protein K6U74_08395, partial [Firmicutes bacterium]|nr:hypothetical protein [Bacillota bacterium]